MRRHSISGSVARIRAGCEEDTVSSANSTEEPNMIVAVRVRPLSSAEKEKGYKSCCAVLNGKIIAIKKEGDPSGYLRSQLASINDYGFDSAFDEHSTQSQVYEGTAKRFIPNVIKGLNVTVFAYGATGAGKTHTMLGNTRADESAAAAEAGIIPQAVFDLFQQLEAKKNSQERFDNEGSRGNSSSSGSSKHTYSVVVSFLEIYNEQVYDLLDSSKSGKVLQLREDPERGIVLCAGCTETVTSSAKEVMSLLAVGNKNRKTEATMANAVSSRSHAVLQLQLRHLERNEAGRETLTESKLSLIDLAGSERASATNNRGARLTEGANINKSLLALANCINALATNSGGGRKTNVKYRDSRLTHLLKSSLEGGNCNLVMIANINPADVTFEDSHNTLKYANRAKNIKVNPAAQAVAVESTWLERENHLRQENQSLRARVAELEALVLQLQQRDVSAEIKPKSEVGGMNSAFVGGRAEQNVDALKTDVISQICVDSSASVSSRRNAATTGSLGYILEETDSFLQAAEDEEQEEYEREEEEEEELEDREEQDEEDEEDEEDLHKAIHEKTAGKSVKNSRKLSWTQQQEEELEREQQEFSEAWGFAVDQSMDAHAICNDELDLALHESQIDVNLSCSVIEAEAPGDCNLSQADIQSCGREDASVDEREVDACEDDICSEDETDPVNVTETAHEQHTSPSKCDVAATDNADDFVQTMNQVAVAVTSAAAPVPGPAVAAAAALKVSSGAAVLTATALSYNAKPAGGTGSVASLSPARPAALMRSAASGFVAANPFFAVLSSARKPAAAVARVVADVESDPKSVDSSSASTTAAVFAAAAESAGTAAPAMSTAVGLFSKRSRAPAVTAEKDAEREMDSLPPQDIQNKRRRTLSGATRKPVAAAAKVAVLPATLATASSNTTEALAAGDMSTAVPASASADATEGGGAYVDEIVNLPVSIKHLPPAPAPAPAPVPAAPAKRVLRRTSIGNSSSAANTNTAATAAAAPAAKLSKEGDKDKVIDKENSTPQVLNRIVSADLACKGAEKRQGKNPDRDQRQSQPEDQDKDQEQEQEQEHDTDQDSKTQPLFKPPKSSVVGRRKSLEGSLAAVNAMLEALTSNTAIVGSKRKAALAESASASAVNAAHAEDSQVRQGGSARGLHARSASSSSSSATAAATSASTTSNKQPARNTVAVVPAQNGAAGVWIDI
jgi:hypothetical protein